MLIESTPTPDDKMDARSVCSTEFYTNLIGEMRGCIPGHLCKDSSAVMHRQVNVELEACCAASLFEDSERKRVV